MEVVTEPDVRSAEQARRYAEELQLVLRTIGASDADMERGQLRVEANVSLRPRGTEAFGTRVEVKNMNSFRSVERAVAFEIERQAAILDAGETLRMETRGWSDDRGETYHMRSKETSDDYRYFPEPDLPPLRVDAAWLREIQGALAGAARATGARGTRTSSGLSAYDAARPRRRRRRGPPVRGDARRRTPGARGQARRELGDRRLPPAPERGRGARRRRRAGRSSRRSSGWSPTGSINRTSAREVLDAHAATGEAVGGDRRPPRPPPDLRHRTRSGRIVDEVIAANPDAVADVRAGKAQAIGFLVGPGDEGDARPGERGRRPGGDPRATRRRRDA